MRALITLLPALCALASASAGFAAPPLPFEGTAQHLGVASCSGSGCHGAARALDEVPVLQNEYTTWSREDAHSNAYKLLQKPEAQRIARQLGHKDATSAKECLVCHSDEVPAAQRGRRYALSDGVACEACHGGAQKWLGPHITGASHAQNLADGLYPLEDPVARARVCLQCHLGTAQRPIDHRIMGAGHPPLDFELSFYSSIQPAHFRVDADYRQRKPKQVSDAKLWAIGQVVAAEMFLDGLLSTRNSERGLYPELVFFDCYACHHPIAPPRWSAGIAGPLGPGEPRLADANLALTGVVLTALAPQAASAWNSALEELHRASGQSVAKSQEGARKLRAQTGAALAAVQARELKKAEALDLLDRLAQAGERQSASYSAARQIYFGSDALALTLRQDHGVAKAALKAPLDELFNAVDAQRTYNPDTMRGALKKMRAAVQQLR